MPARYSVNCSILFTELPLLDRARAARDCGFDAVEFWWPFATANPSSSQVREFVDSIADAGVRLTGLNFFAGDMPGGDRGLLSWPGRESEFRASVDLAVAIADELGCARFNALYGNPLAGHTDAEQGEAAMGNLAYASAAVAALPDAQVLIEPISGDTGYPLRLASDAANVVEAAISQGYTNVRILVDLYHLAVNGDDLMNVARLYGHLTGHIQIADAPGRGQPGSGELDLASPLRRLLSEGYDGWIGLEYKPTGPSAESFDWLDLANPDALPGESSMGGVA